LILLWDSVRLFVVDTIEGLDLWATVRRLDAASVSALNSTMVLSLHLGTHVSDGPEAEPKE